jgi:VWFA-related protein
MRLRNGIFSLALALPAFAVAARAQLAPSPDAPPVSTAPAPPVEDAPDATYKVNVNLVDLFFTVKDKNGNLVPHLNQQNCSVEENKEPQTFKSFVAQTDLPLTLGILLDTSGSQYRLLPMEKDAAGQFVRQVLRSKDEAFLVAFDVNVDLLQDYTNSPRLLSHALDKAEINTAGGNGSGIPGLGGGTIPTIGDPKGTLLYDAIYQAANDKMNQETGRKAMIVLTDGEDEGSQRKIGEAIAAAEKNNVIVYVILLADRAMYWSQGEGYFGYGPAKRISDETGGRLIDVGNKGDKLQAAFQQIQDELRTQYLASYTSTDTRADGAFRKVILQCHGDQGPDQELKVQLRKGYYAPSPQN